MITIAVIGVVIISLLVWDAIREEKLYRQGKDLVKRMEK